MFLLRVQYIIGISVVYTIYCCLLNRVEMAVGVDERASIVVDKQQDGGGEVGLRKRKKKGKNTLIGWCVVENLAFSTKRIAVVNEGISGTTFGGGGGRSFNARRVVTHPVQEREVFELAAERVVNGIHFDRYVDMYVVEVHRVDEYDGADHVHGDVSRR